MPLLALPLTTRCGTTHRPDSRTGLVAPAATRTHNTISFHTRGCLSLLTDVWTPFRCLWLLAFTWLHGRFAPPDPLARLPLYITIFTHPMVGITYHHLRTHDSAFACTGTRLRGRASATAHHAGILGRADACTRTTRTHLVCATHAASLRHILPFIWTSRDLLFRCAHAPDALHAGRTPNTRLPRHHLTSFRYAPPHRWDCFFATHCCGARWTFATRCLAASHPHALDKMRTLDACWAWDGLVTASLLRATRVHLRHASRCLCRCLFACRAFVRSFRFYLYHYRGTRRSFISTGCLSRCASHKFCLYRCGHHEQTHFLVTHSDFEQRFQVPSLDCHLSFLWAYHSSNLGRFVLRHASRAGSITRSCNASFRTPDTPTDASFCTVTRARRTVPHVLPSRTRRRCYRTRRAYLRLPFICWTPRDV